MKKGYLKQRFGVNLRRLRSDKGITQEELADRASVSLVTIHNIEHGINGPRFDLIEKLAYAIGVDPEEFFKAQ